MAAAKRKPKQTKRRKTANGNGESRRELIGDTILRILAEDGARGLTHRAVDRYLKLPEGTTSAYCRRRIDLLRTGFEYLTELLRRDVIAQFDTIATHKGVRPDLRVADAAARYAELWKKYVGADKYRFMAHLELRLAATRDPQCRLIEEETYARTEAAAAALFARMGAKNPVLAAMEFCHLMQSETWIDLLVPKKFHGHDVNQAYFERRFRQIIDDTNLRKRTPPRQIFLR